MKFLHNVIYKGTLTAEGAVTLSNNVQIGDSRLDVHNVYGALTVGNGSTGTDVTALTVLAMGTGGSINFRVRNTNNNGDVLAIVENEYIGIGGTAFPTNGRTGFTFDASGVSSQAFNIITRSNNTSSVYRGLVVTEGNLIGTSGGSFDSRYVEVKPTFNAVDGVNFTIRGFYYNPTITNLVAATVNHYAWENTIGDIKMGNLAGTGTRMVVADSVGKLSTQAVPNDVSISNNSQYRIITGGSGNNLAAQAGLVFYDNIGAMYIESVGSYGYGAGLEFVNTNVNGTQWGFYGGSTTDTGFMLYRYLPTQYELAYWNTDRYSVRSDIKIGWSSTLLSFNAMDTALAREAAGLVQINNGSLNSYASLKLLNVTATSLAGVGTRMVVADANGLLGTQAIPTGGGGSSYLTGLSDVNITSPANNQLFKYDSASSKWINWTPNYLTSYTEIYQGTVTSVAALTIGTSGTDITSTVANGTTTPVITLNIPTASATNRGALSSTDWSTFNNKQAAISLTTTGSSGSATFSSNTLNIPTYTLAGLGGQPSSTNLTSLAGLSYTSASFVKMTAAGTFTLDTNTYYLASNPSGYTNNTGTVTSVSALTIGTTGTDITSTVATGTTTPVITLNIPDASATARGVITTGTQTIAGAKTYRGTTATDDVALSAELLTNTGSGTNWSGTGFSTGYTHTAGSTTALSASFSASSGTYYKLVVTTTNVTAGYADVAFGGRVFTIFGNGTSTYATIASSNTSTLTVTPTSTYDGTMVISIKSFTQSTPLVTHQVSSGTIANEVRVNGNSIYWGRAAGRYAFGSALNNAVFGHNSLSNLTTGVNNTAFGISALTSISNETSNTAFGYFALNYATSNNNTAVGSVALGYNTTGSYNTAVGSGALSGFNSTAGYNIGIGYNSGSNLSSGSNNTIVGYNGFLNATTASNSIAIGYEAGRYAGSGSTSLTVATNSVFIGYSVRPGADSQTNQIVIGNSTVGQGSNTTTIGNSSTTLTYLYGSLQQTAVTSALLKADSTGKLIAAVAGTDYLTSNQTITLSGAVTGSGTTAITTTLANSVVGIANLSATGTPSSNTYLRGDNTWATITAGGTGTVTSVSVVSANGFAGTVATNTTTPAITLSTTVTGLLKGDGTSISAAVAGTDYLSSAITSIGVSGSLQTGAAQTLAVGTSGTNFNITSSGNTHTFNIPDASSSARGLITTGTQTLAGAKTFSSTLTASSTLSINGGVLAGNNIVSMRANSGGGQFRIERSDGTLCQYPFYVGSNGNPASYFYATDGTTLRIVFHIDTPSYLYNKLAIGQATWTAASAITEMLEVNGYAKATGFKTGGTSSQFLKADGSVDSSVYLTTVSVSNISATGTPSATTYLRGDGTWSTITTGGTGTVTSVSVVSANGFAGTVATDTTTPAITLSTTVTGLLKGNGTAISAAVANTDYLPVNNPAFTGVLSTGTLTYTPANNLFGLQTSVNSYSQTIIQNSNAGSTASADIVVNNNLSTDTTYYGDFGINSSTFTGSSSLGLANAVYLTATTGDLVLGTTTSNAIHFVINSGATDAAVIKTTSQLQLPAYTTTTSFTGTVAGYLAFDSSGNVITTAAPTGGSAYTVTAQTANYTVTNTSGTIIVKGDTSGGTFTVTLPTAVSNTATIIVKKTAGSAGLVIDGAGTETIDGGLTATLNKVNESVTLISDNANWQIV